MTMITAYIATLAFPDIDPIIFSVGPFAIRWYALAYIVGIMFAIWYAKRLVNTKKLWGSDGPPATALQVDNMLLWATAGVIVGGRLGYVLFYQPDYYFSHPAKILMTWNGGMSFHGGLLGVTLCFLAFSRIYKLPIIRLLDIAAAGVPVGLGLGRIANFINGELFGKITTVPWAMVFPRGGPLPRHPSQLYEAALEGIVLFSLLYIACHSYRALSRPGQMAGLFILGYGLSRFFVEFFRSPDEFLGYYYGEWLTMGMMLSLPLILLGLWLTLRAKEAA